MAGFIDRLEDVNALADHAPGFVWRLQDDSGDATAIKISDDPRFIVNLSVWDSTEALHDFVCRTVHAELIAGRRGWFHHARGAYPARWWVAAGTLPTPQESLARIEDLRRRGPSARAFTYKTRFPAPLGALAEAT